MRAERSREKKDQEKLALRLAATPQQRRISAYHESSHAVLGELFDFPVEYLTCLPRMVSANHPAVRAGIVAVSTSSCQFVLTDGIVPLPTADRRLFFLIALLASLPTEEKIGRPDAEIVISCAGDVIVGMETMNEDLPVTSKLNMLRWTRDLARAFVNHALVWKAIDLTAKLLFEKGKIQGEAVRAIIRDNVPSVIFFSKEKQRRILQGDNPTSLIMAPLTLKEAA